MLKNISASAIAVVLLGASFAMAQTNASKASAVGIWKLDLKQSALGSEPAGARRPAPSHGRSEAAAAERPLEVIGLQYAVAFAADWMKPRACPSRVLRRAGDEVIQLAGGTQ